MKLVYIAGPIKKGNLLDNIKQAHEAAIQLLKAGFSVICPHGSCFWGHQITPDGMGLRAEILPQGTKCEDWYGCDVELVKRVDLVLRLPGESKGADLEETTAKQHNIPVYHNIQELIRGES